MSRKPLQNGAVLEWSPTHVSWVNENHELITVGSLLEAASRINTRDVLIAVSRRSIFIRAYRVPNAGKPEVRRILDIQIGQIFPMSASELAYDFLLTEDVNAEGRLAVLVAMRSADLNSLHEQARAAGLRVTKVVPVAVGSAMLARDIGQPDGALVHRTAEGLAVDIVNNGELRYSRIAPMPATSLGIEGEVSRTFAAALLPCCPTIAAGGIALAEAEISTPLWALEALAGHAGDRIPLQIVTQEQLLFAETAQQRARIRMAFLLFAAAALMLVGVSMKMSDRQAIASRAIGKWETKLRKLRAIREEELNKSNTLTNLKTTLDRGFHPAQFVSDTITTAVNGTPVDVWLTGMSLERGKALSLRGTATRGEAVANYQQALVSDPRFRDVQLVFANNTAIEAAPVVQFSISAFPIGNLPLIDLTKKGVVAKK